jgi:type IV pilus assembly protein PilB
MGIPNYLVAGATRLIMAQRMTRKICQVCKEEISLKEEQIEALAVPNEMLKNLKAFKGKGCNECNNTGLSGRTGIYEVMPISHKIERMILANASESDLRDQAVADGMLTLRMAAVDKMIKGIISVEEVFATTS